MTTPAAVAAQLRSRILDLSVGPGRPLREVVLSEEFGCSRRSVREALLELHREGLVVHERHRGAAVRAFTTDDVRDLYRVRATLELEGARACGAASEDALRRMDLALEGLRQAAVASQDSAEHAVRDMEFHAGVVALAGSPRLSECFGRIALEMAYAIRLLQRHEVLEHVGVEEVLAEHERIAESARRGNARATADLVAEHIAVNRDRLVARS